MILSLNTALLSKNGRSGFTLLELLVVISVMALMMGFIGFSLLGGGGSSLDAAQREMVSLVQQTRMQATLSGRETRLIVHDDPAVPEKFHRYLEIVVEDANVTGAWRPLGQGHFFPKELISFLMRNASALVWRVPPMIFGQARLTPSGVGMPPRIFSSVR